ncbi:UNVERIFIED_CONTAM: hypothetical protein PYX00_011694 [Menopon gallinae]|uniref:non-specific serine/threonine protein kinase n=1 Tax=Menopon gallinae TaxID=328185 RepID=A0AAW2H8F8_9NEOP
MKKQLHEIGGAYIAGARQRANAMLRKRSVVRWLLFMAVAVLFLITKKILDSMAREQISKNVFIAIDAHVDMCLGTSDRKEQNSRFRAFPNSLGLRPIKMTPYTAVLLYTGNAKPVVIKRVIFREDSPSQEDVISRVVQHRNIMKTYKTFRSRFVNRKSERQTIIWLISEYLTLRLSHRYVNRNEEVIRRIVRDALLALEYLHTMNIAHLDIKIENIMGKEVDGAVRFKLIDLGYGRMLDNDVGGREMSETYIPTKSYGTFPYKPPEVVRENVHGLKSDIYCIGAVAWFLSLGKTPFYTDGERDLQAFRRFLASGIRLRFREDTSPALQDFVEQCMHPSARERPDASQLLQHHFEPEGMGAAHKYLLSLLPLYRKTGNEAYVLSRLLNTGNVPADVQALFCAGCLVLFEPGVNCRREETRDCVRTTCRSCGSKTSAGRDACRAVSGEEAAESMDFEDLFSWLP